MELRWEGESFELKKALVEVVDELVDAGCTGFENPRRRGGVIEGEEGFEMEVLDKGGQFREAADVGKLDGDRHWDRELREVGREEVAKVEGQL